MTAFQRFLLLKPTNHSHLAPCTQFTSLFNNPDPQRRNLLTIGNVELRSITVTVLAKLGIM